LVWKSRTVTTTFELKGVYPKHRNVERQVKVLIKNLAIFFQAFSANIIPNSAVGIFSLKTEGTQT
jgi:hypothetical protein